MIYIREIVPKKWSGLSSFLITFNFNQKIIETLKTLSLKYYHKALQAWEIPQECLAEALDALTFIDDIQLIMRPETEVVSNSDNFNLTEKEIKELKFSPFAHQIDGINYGLARKQWLLLDSMGLG